MRYFLLGFLSLLLTACIDNASPKNEAVGKPVSSIENRADDTTFEGFWKMFKNKVLNDQRHEAALFVSYPFTDRYNDIYDASASLTSKDSSEFLKNYNAIFDSTVIRAIRSDNYEINNNGVADSVQHTQDNAVEFILKTNNPERSKDLVFRKIAGRYRLIAIEYYP